MAVADGAAVQVTVRCQMVPLVRAVRAVAPHTGSEKAGTGLERVRLVVDEAGMRLSLVATDGVSAAVASVLLDEADGPGQDEPVEVDLLAASAKLIGRIHALRGGDDEGARAEVVIDPRLGTVQVTDVTGLWPGRSVRLRTQPEWFSEEGLERQDGASMVMEACAEPLAGDATLILPSDALRPWSATARELGGLPLRATTGGHLVVAQGDADSQMLFLGARSSTAPTRQWPLTGPMPAQAQRSSWTW